LVVDLLRDLACENLGRSLLLQDVVLTERQNTLKEELTQGEPHKDVLPWEERPIEDTRELLAHLSANKFPTDETKRKI
jgi:hypothetical protein